MLEIKLGIVCRNFERILIFLIECMIINQSACDMVS